MESFDIKGPCVTGTEGVCLEASHLMWRMNRRLPRQPENDMRRVYVYRTKAPGGAGEAERFMEKLTESIGEI